MTSRISIHIILLKYFLQLFNLYLDQTYKLFFSDLDVKIQPHLFTKMFLINYAFEEMH